MWNNRNWPIHILIFYIKIVLGESLLEYSSWIFCDCLDSFNSRSTNFYLIHSWLIFIDKVVYLANVMTIWSLLDQFQTVLHRMSGSQDSIHGQRISEHCHSIWNDGKYLKQPPPMIIIYIVTWLVYLINPRRNMLLWASLPLVWCTALTTVCSSKVSNNWHIDRILHWKK